MSEIAQLHPIVQGVAIVCITVVAIAWLYFMTKSL